MVTSNSSHIIDRITRNTGFLTVARVIEILSGVLLIGIIARYLGVEWTGKYFLIIAIISFLQSIVRFGFDVILVREISKDKEHANRYFGTCLLLQGIIAIIILGAISMITAFLPLTRVEIIALYIGFVTYLVLLAASNSCLAVFQAFEKMGYEPFLVTINQTVLLSGVALVAWLDMGFIALFIASLIAAFSQALFAASILCRNFFIPIFRMDVEILKDLIRESSPQAITDFFREALLRVPVFILAVFVGTHGVALFEGPWRLLIRILILPASFIRALLPSLSQSAVNSKKLFQTSFSISFKVIGVLNIILPIFLTLFADKIIIFILGRGFENAVIPLQILSWVIVPVSFDMILSITLISINKQNLVAKNVIFAFIANLLMCIIFIPIYGVIGGCIATLFSSFILFICMLYDAAKYVSIVTPMKMIMKPYFAAILLMVYIYYMKYVMKQTMTDSILISLSSVAIYLFLLKLFKAFSKEEMEFFSNKFTRKGFKWN